MSIPTWFTVSVALIAGIAGATASVAGFGIGSLLTPLLAWQFGTSVAVAVVALPHLAGSLLRGWLLRSAIDRTVLIQFGILSALGGLAGALVFARLAPVMLGRVLGALLLLTAIAGFTSWSNRWKPQGPVPWLLGALSGFFGGVVGNQGGLRAAALTRFDLSPTGFVATSTAVGIVIDLVRTPIYLQRTGTRLAHLWPLVGIAIAGVLAGTLLGERVLLGLSRERFRRLISIAIGLLGIWFLLQPA